MAPNMRATNRRWDHLGACALRIVRCACGRRRLDSLGVSQVDRVSDRGSSGLELTRTRSRSRSPPPLLPSSPQVRRLVYRMRKAEGQRSAWNNPRPLGSEVSGQGRYILVIPSIDRFVVPPSLPL
ncbi:hypothetical protein AG1IA_05154 [Rhizoctonia solani AG-1 IA]|uniref:Uncharacterized protein n=1 Tax=Thanatephorus cucumeris (strain AG1-IA) TaxID=983506 RepID=L8WVM4_THACA|nr:hypothetical protein AG1IA_05154 [Rhizoctonia solani AG-1 IA]